MSARGWTQVTTSEAGALRLRGVKVRMLRLNWSGAPTWAVLLWRLEQLVVSLAAPGASVAPYAPACDVDWGKVWAKARRYPRWRRALLAVYFLDGADRRCLATIDWLLANGARAERVSLVS